MIGIHLYGKVYWFDFPHTLESQDQLIARLERESRKRMPLGDRVAEMNRDLEKFADQIGQASTKVVDGLSKACEEIGRLNDKPVGVALKDAEWDQKSKRYHTEVKLY